VSKIIIEMVPATKMRLAAYRDQGRGDWFIAPNGNIHIQYSSAEDIYDNDDNLILRPGFMDDDDAFLLVLHELIEMKLCMKDGVTQGAVDAFDANFKGEGEPGDDPAAPYRVQHRKACLIEFLMASFLGKHDHGSMF